MFHDSFGSPLCRFSAGTNHHYTCFLYFVKYNKTVRSLHLRAVSVSVEPPARTAQRAHHVKVVPPSASSNAFRFGCRAPVGMHPASVLPPRFPPGGQQRQARGLRLAVGKRRHLRLLHPMGNRTGKQARTLIPLAEERLATIRLRVYEYSRHTRFDRRQN